jgi:sulfur-carrier protein adenylyltransferase/sulfurtransferase
VSEGGGTKQNGSRVPEISPTELRERLEREQPLVLLDVREPFERDIADLPGEGQLRIPMAELLSRMDELDADANLVVYCRSGARSNWAVQQLRAHGFEKAMNLAGGVMKWREDVDPSLTEY